MVAHKKSKIRLTLLKIIKLLIAPTSAASSGGQVAKLVLPEAPRMVSLPHYHQTEFFEALTLPYLTPFWNRKDMTSAFHKPD